jgi:lysyl-tRNA synthetase class 2
MHPELLTSRAEMLARCRAFFQDRGVMEVDCCALSPYAAIDSNIDVINAYVTPSELAYLHTSPEYAMKRLLSAGIGDIYYLGHVFRQGEIGRIHNPEFTMAEWYRIGFTFDQMIQETCDFLSLFLGPLPVRKIGYREAFEQYVGIDYTSLDQLQKAASNTSWDESTLRHYLLTHAIEPHFGQNELTILLDFPPDEAALARTIQKNGETVAERFEAYYQSIELCNGYHELPDGHELRRRFHEENDLRAKEGKAPYALDEAFLSALGSHFPDCCGVSVGVDRAFLLQRKAKSLSEVLPFILKQLEGSGI